MVFEKVIENGRTFIKTVLQDNPESKYFTGHNVEMLVIDGISDEVIEEVIEGTIVNNLFKFIDSFDKAEKILIGNEKGELITVMRKAYLDNSCIIINRIIVPDDNNRYPWDDDCDPRYKAQWSDEDEAQAQEIAKNFELAPVEAARNTSVA